MKAVGGEGGGRGLTDAEQRQWEGKAGGGAERCGRRWQTKPVVRAKPKAAFGGETSETIESKSSRPTAEAAGNHIA